MKGPHTKQSLANFPGWSNPQTSRIVLVPIAMPADPRNPQRKRHVRSVAKSRAAPEPPAKAIKHDELAMYSHRQPINSDRGARTRGPNDRPNKYTVVVSRATVWLILNSDISADVAGVLTDAENVLHLVKTLSTKMLYTLQVWVPDLH